MTKVFGNPPIREQPEHGSGYFVLAMGKHGAFELNYSSDIDLDRLFRPRQITRWPLAVDLQSFFVRMTRDLVLLLEERTAGRLRVSHRPATEARRRRNATRALDRRCTRLL